MDYDLGKRHLDAATPWNTLVSHALREVYIQGVRDHVTIIQGGDNSQN